LEDRDQGSLRAEMPGTFASMSPALESTVAQLRSPDPATRLAGARQLVQLAARTDVDLGPALLASVDAAGMPFPTDETVRPYPFREALHQAWRTAATDHPQAAAAWFAAVVDRLDGGDEQSGLRLLQVLTNDPWTAPDGKPTPYTSLLNAHADRLVAILRRLASAGANAADDREQRDGRWGLLALMIRQQAARNEPLIAQLADLAPVLLRASRAENVLWIELVLEHHREPLDGLAALMDEMVTRPRGGTGEDLANILLPWGGEFDRIDVDLVGLADSLRPYAQRWTGEQLDWLVRAALLDTDSDDTPLTVALRRAAARRAVPQMLVGLGRDSAAIRELAARLDARVDPARNGPEPAHREAVDFVDENLRMAVIDELMYRQQVLTPAFDLDIFVNTYEGRELDPYAANHVLNEVWDHFMALPLTPAHLAHVENLAIGVTAEIWNRIDPGWGGEEDTTPATFDDVVHLPNLRRVEIDVLDDGRDLSTLYARGIEVVILYGGRSDE
jgi:hypothetical protein